MQLIEQHINADVYDKGDGIRVARVGVFNPPPFDEEGSCATPTFDGKVERIRPGVWRYRGALMGIEVDTNPGSARLRMHPVRSSWSKYYEIGLTTNHALQIKRIHKQLVEVYLDLPNIRVSFFLTPKGVVKDIVLKNSSAPDTFKLNVSTNGLTKKGRTLVDPDTGQIVARLPKPFLVDSGEGLSRIERPVGEVLNAGVLTLSADLTDCIFPVHVDPSVFGITPDMDASLWGRSGFQNNNYGGDETRMFSLTSVIGYQAHQWDLSALGIVTVNSAIMNFYQHSGFGNSSAANLVVQQLTETMLTEGTGTWAAATTDGVSWNYRNALTTLWAVAGGQVGAASTIYQSGISSIGWHRPDVTSSVQEAVDTYNSIATLRTRFQGLGGSNLQIYSRSKEYVDPNFWPFLDVTYTVAAGTSRSAFAHPLGIRSGFTGDGSKFGKPISVKGGF